MPHYKVCIFPRPRKQPEANVPEQSDSVSVPALDLVTSVEKSTHVPMPLQQLDYSPNSTSLQTSSVAPSSVSSLITTSSSVSNPISIDSRETTPSDLNTKYPTQPRLSKYPKDKFGDRLRSFDPSWYEKHPWLEYSALWDCYFCFTCRVFGNASKKNYFSKGFSDWKHAFGAGKGLDVHKASKQHKISYSIWLEKKKREDTGTIISNSWRKSSLDQLKWLEAIFLVTRHLASNGLPFRGDVECYVSRGLAGGLFLNTFSDLLFYFQPELKEIALRLPKNSSYVTKDIQNESISDLAELVHQKVADEVKAAKVFTIMVDGTTDKHFQEMQGLVVRYFSKEEECIIEKALDIGPSGLSASDIFQFVRTSIEKYGLTFDGLVPQAYDGASVMSGNRKGLQKLLSDHCLRLVIYIQSQSRS